ncbi:LON peptidase substrate-binding domain-containing protein [Jatrophihabitans sp. YIM 134969]
MDSAVPPGGPTRSRVDRLALFPLPGPLFPGTPLPLHVFEPRYRQLVADVEAAEPIHQHFGVVSICSPAGMTPAATTDDLRTIGTSARVLDVRPLADGRYDLTTIGSRRFRLLRLVDDGAHPYLVGEIEWIDRPLREEEDVPEPLVTNVTEAFDRYVSTVAALQDLTLEDLDLPSSGESLSWTVATVALFSGDERHDLLATVSARERLLLELGMLRREIALMRATRTLPASDGMLAVEHSDS